MSNEQAAPETKGVTVELLATVDLGPEIEGMAGRQLRMRMVTLEASSARFTTIKTDQASSTYCKERSLTIEMESLRTMGREWAGPRIGAPHTGLRTEVRFRRWRSRSI
jgi:delta 1-pyrroline-5-carboxylate dehydrogenase